MLTNLIYWFKARLEEAQVFGFIDHLEPPGLLAGIIDRLYRFSDHIHMGLGVDPARDSQAGQLQGREAMIAGLRIPSGTDVASLHSAHSRIQVQLGG